jgi:hypothetical protein
MNDLKKRLERTKTRPASRRREAAARPRPVDPELHLAPPFTRCGVGPAESAQAATIDVSFTKALSQPRSARTPNPARLAH